MTILLWSFQTLRKVFTKFWNIYLQLFIVCVKTVEREWIVEWVVIIWSILKILCYDNSKYHNRVCSRQNTSTFLNPHWGMYYMLCFELSLMAFSVKNSRGGCLDSIGGWGAGGWVWGGGGMMQKLNSLIEKMDQDFLAERGAAVPIYNALSVAGFFVTWKIWNLDN